MSQSAGLKVGSSPEHEGIGRVIVDSIPLPEHVRRPNGTYTYSGKVLITYCTENDLNIADYYHLAVMDDDGTNFRTFFSGVIPTLPKANGIRFMPFRDNKRVLLGDYVLECTPDIDTCTKTELVRVAYPSVIDEDPNTTHRWSEIIIAPDNKHMSWTILRADIGAAVGIGELTRQTDAYEIENAQIISTLADFQQDPKHPEFIIPQIVRGGEVKQFVRGGNAISAVGAMKNATPDSIMQDLASENMTQITNTPGYNETTIFSPDERLGIVMSTRFSQRTDPAIFGLLPRPYATLTLSGMMWSLYMYAIDGVRKFRPGNIGPVLIDIERSIHESGYEGIQLTTDDNWVYLSPMSWHPDGKRAMWPEMVRGSDGARTRLQKVTLLDYEPKEAVLFEDTTNNIPYGIKDISVLKNPIQQNVEGKIAGKHSGYIQYSRSSFSHEGRTESQYYNFSDDGVHFYNGFEKTAYNLVGENRYEVDLRLEGPRNGEMKLRVVFSAVFGPAPTKLLFEPDIDGNPKSYGYASYNGVTLNVEELLE